MKAKDICIHNFKVMLFILFLIKYSKKDVFEHQNFDVLFFLNIFVEIFADLVSQQK